MTTRTKLHRLGSWSVRCLGVAVALAFCASVNAEPNRKVELAKLQKNVRKVCYTYISGNATPQSCDRLGSIPTTSYPMDRVGGGKR